MNMHSTSQPSIALDEIRCFLPKVSDAEWQQRNRIRVARIVATGRIVELQAGTAVQLLWMVVDTATTWMLRPATPAMLEKVVEQCRRLLIVADTAAQLETADGPE